MSLADADDFCRQGFASYSNHIDTSYGFPAELEDGANTTAPHGTAAQERGNNPPDSVFWGQHAGSSPLESRAHDDQSVGWRARGDPDENDEDEGLRAEVGELRQELAAVRRDLAAVLAKL